MELKLYHYVHCPFCVRVRICLDYLNTAYDSLVLPYDDESTPEALTGIKMLPIMKINGESLNESLDIIQKLDQQKMLDFDNYKKNQKLIEKTLNDLGTDVHNLAMPYWIYTPEFDDKSRAYFQKKKEKKRGPFNKLVQMDKKYKDSLLKTLSALESKISPWFLTKSFDICDVLLYSHIVGMYVVPGFQFPKIIFDYMKRVEKKSNFNYHDPFWFDNSSFSKSIRRDL